jgi:hypothetical protein
MPLGNVHVPLAELARFLDKGNSLSISPNLISAIKKIKKIFKIYIGE